MSPHFRLFLIALALLSFSGPLLAGEAATSWTHPTQYTDGTALPIGQIARTELEYGLCNAGKTGFLATPAPVIVSEDDAPLRGVRHVMRTSKPEPLVLRAETASSVRTIYWFAGDALIGQSAPGEGITWMPPMAKASERHTLRAVSDQGQSESREITVDIVP